MIVDEGFLPEMLAQAPGELVAVHARHAEVHQRVRRPPALTDRKRARAVIGDPHLCAVPAKQQSNALGEVSVVVHHQHPPRGKALRLRRGRPL